MADVAPIVNELRKDGAQDLSEDQCMVLLDNFDRDGSGLVTIADLHFLLTCLGEKLSEEEFEELMREQKVQEGRVNSQAMARIITGGGRDSNC